jgi:Protein trafficking PGA2
MTDAFEALTAWLNQIQQNAIDVFSRMTLEKYIRLIVIVGAYALLRPYILKLAGKQQTKEHEKGIDVKDMPSPAVGLPRSLRDQVQVPEDSDDEEATGADWGKKARRRQRQVVRKILEADEKLRKEKEGDDEDKDIEEFLVG